MVAILAVILDFTKNWKSGKNDENWYYLSKYFGLFYSQGFLLWLKEVETNISLKHCLTTLYLWRHNS